jgi:hypothetical protein
MQAVLREELIANESHWKIDCLGSTSRPILVAGRIGGLSPQYSRRSFAIRSLGSKNYFFSSNQLPQICKFLKVSHEISVVFF